jgi:hypothetical protein
VIRLSLSLSPSLPPWFQYYTHTRIIHITTHFLIIKKRSFLVANYNEISLITSQRHAERECREVILFVIKMSLLSPVENYVSGISMGARARLFV